MSSEHPCRDPVESAAKGATRAILDYSEEKLKEWIAKFRNRELAFVKDPHAIKTAKELRSVPEWNQFIRYVKDPRLRVLFQMGLTLRKLEREKVDIRPLRDRIFKKFDTEGLHIAQVVQNGIFSKYVGNVIEKVLTEEMLKSEIENLFYSIERTVAFIKAKDYVGKRANELYSLISAHRPKIFIISSADHVKDKCERIKEVLMNKLSDYEPELYETTNKKMYFLNRIHYDDS